MTTKRARTPPVPVPLSTHDADAGDDDYDDADDDYPMTAKVGKVGSSQGRQQHVHTH